MEQLAAEFERQFSGRDPLPGSPFPGVGREKDARMLEQQGLILFRRQHLARDQVALIGPAAGQFRLQKAQSLGRVARVDGSQHLFAMNAQRASRIAKRRNLLRRALAHGWFSTTSVCLRAKKL